MAPSPNLPPPTLRRYAFYMFGAIQVVKLAAAIAAASNAQESPHALHITFFSACIADFVFVVGLRYARIPWLAFSLLGSAVVFAALAILNLGFIAFLASLSAELEPAPAAGTLPTAQNVPANIPIRSDAQLDRSSNVDALLNASYILGSHTVTVRPPTIAQLNPNASVFCIPPSSAASTAGSTRTFVNYKDLPQSQQPALIPLLVRGTPPFVVEFEILSDGNSHTAGASQSAISVGRSIHTLNLTADDEVVPILRPDGSVESFNKQPSSADQSTKRHLATFAIPAHVTGVYRILSVREPTGDEGRISASRHAQVVQCPSAAWQWSNPPSHGSNASPPSRAHPYEDDSVAPVPEDAADGHPLFDRCTDDPFTALIDVRGVPPLTIMYIKQVGSTETVATVDSGEILIADDSDSAASVGGWSILPSSMRSKQSVSSMLAALDQETRTLVQSGRIVQATVPISFVVDQQNEHIFRIARIVDGLNNTIDYQTHSSVEIPDPLQKNTAMRLQIPGDLFVVRGHAHPSVRFTDCDGFKLRAGESKNLSLILDGQSPFSVSVRHIMSDNDSDDTTANDKGHIKKIDQLVGPTGNIPASAAGSYELVDVHDKFCSGDVRLPSKCLVQQVAPPIMTLSSSPIEEKCLGAVGASMNLSFTGEPPFWVEYLEERTVASHPKRDTQFQYSRQPPPRVDKRLFMIEDIQKPRHTLALSPGEPGTYRYAFTRVGDANYPEGVALSDLSITQIIHPHSTAQFVGTESRHVRCINDTVKLPVSVHGSGPWTLVYYVVHNSQRSRHSVQVTLDQAVMELDIDNLISSGSYLVDLAEITDVNGCVETISSPGRTIEVLPQRPTVNFQTTRPIHIVEGGRASLPISVSGKPPFEVRYRSAGAGVQTSRNGRDLEVFGAGTFELVSIRDRFCEGTAVEPRQLDVVQIPRPSLSLADDTALDASVCQGVHDGVQVNLAGKPPFVVEYEHIYTLNAVSSKTLKSETQRRKIETRADTFTIVFDTSRDGVHVYRILTMSDANYPAPKPVIPAESVMGTAGGGKYTGDVIEMRRRVNRPPTVQFEEPGEHVYQCSAATGPKSFGLETGKSTKRFSGLLGLGVRLTGVPPFTLAVDRKYDNQRATRLNFTLNESDFAGESGSGHQDGVWSTRLDLGALEEQGRYDFTLASVMDGTGCSAYTPKSGSAGSADQAAVASAGSALSATGATVSIHVADQAKITSTNPPIVCVGDILTYRLQGSPPFTVGYTWNGVPQSNIVVADPVMTLWAGTAGEVTITRVCNAMGCCNDAVSEDSSMHTTVKSLPRAMVDGGHDTIDDIREGDESEVVVELVGEPPFGFSYSFAKSASAVAAVSAAAAASSQQSSRTGSNPPNPLGSSGSLAHQPPSSSQDISQDGVVSISVVGIDTHVWRLRTSQEGIFRVTSVHDRYCGYPRIIQSTSGANAILK